MQLEREGQRGRDDHQPLDDVVQPNRAVDGEGRLTPGLVQGEQETGKAPAMIAVIVGDEQPVNAQKAPAKAADLRLRAFAAVDEQGTAAVAQVQARQRAVGYGDGTAGAQSAYVAC